MNNRFVTAYLLLVSAQLVAGTYFVNNGDANCTYPVSASINDISCSNGSENRTVDASFCTFGDTMFISGEITLEESLPSSDMCVTTKLCFFGVDFLCTSSTKTMDVCNAVGVSNENDGTACPNAGTFYFGTSTKVPWKPYIRLGSGKMEAQVVTYFLSFPGPFLSFVLSFPSNLFVAFS
jgi:hypothetical protein